MFPKFKAPNFVFLTIAQFLLAAVSTAQWSDVQYLGQGGEPNLAADGKGNVYLSTQEPGRILASDAWGANLKVLRRFSHELGDTCVVPIGGRNIAYAFMRSFTPGISVWRGTGFHDFFAPMSLVAGDPDREWLGYDPTNDNLLMVYAKGSISRPGGIVFSGASMDDAAFTTLEDIGDEFSYDPSFAVSTCGTNRYLLWQHSANRSTMDRYYFASQTAGETFSTRLQIAIPVFPGDPTYNKEDWTQACVASSGDNTVVIAYPKYTSKLVDGIRTDCLLLYFRVSFNGGSSFEHEQSVLPPSELSHAIRQFQRSPGPLTLPYIETQPWISTDANGRFHIAFLDNRNGYDKGDSDSGNGTVFGQWTVRHAECLNALDTFEQSENVSNMWRAERPPLDFLGCAADSRYVYVTWREGAKGGTAKSPLYFARKPLD
jgi:hypothetical protein